MLDFNRAMLTALSGKVKPQTLAAPVLDQRSDLVSGNRMPILGIRTSSKAGSECAEAKPHGMPAGPR